MSRVIHFEIHAENPERAVNFYSALFQWQFQKWDGPMEYWVISTGPKDQPGIDGGLMRRQGPGPSAEPPISAFVCTVNVDNLDATTTAVGKLGGMVVLPKMPVPGIGWLAYAKDTEGNIFGMMQNDPNAK
jgi:predicted enzyme related to lactoylglutathione lyase